LIHDVWLFARALPTASQRKHENNPRAQKIASHHRGSFQPGDGALRLIRKQFDYLLVYAHKFHSDQALSD
jgi:hypothetical protein